MTATIFFEVFSGVLFVSGVMVQFNVAFQKGFLSILILILASGLSFGMTYIYCYTGSLVHSALLQRSEYTYEVQWYRFPIKYQKFIPMILSETQREHYFEGFGIVRLEYSTYTMV